MLQELSAASLGQHSRTLCLSYSQEKVLHFKSQKWMSGKLHVANRTSAASSFSQTLALGRLPHTRHSPVGLLSFF